MTTYIALLRAINVAGTRSVAMSDLRAFVEALGFDDVRTLLQTGNVVFEGKPQRSATLERLLESEAQKRLALQTDFMVRTDKELSAIVGQNPFPAEAKRDPGHLVVQFLKDAPSAAAVKSLQAAIAGPEFAHARMKQLYVVYPAGIGRSKLTAKLLESKLCTRATGRNWNTMLRLAALANG
jgi:uncharacterized protein (DUF1697 family)